MLTTSKPIAVVSPMKKIKKAKKKKNSISKSGEVKHKNYGGACSYTDDLCKKRRSGEERNTPFFPYPLKRSLPNCIKRLCAKVDGLSLSPIPKLIDDYGPIPEHDRKILERMAAKMQKDISNMEMAHQAHIVWENEKEHRKKLQQEQEEEYKIYLKNKRAAEKAFYEKRNLENREIHDWEKEHLKDHIQLKDDAAENRLKMLNYKKLNMIQEKQEISKEKFEHVLVALRQRQVEDIIWRTSLAENTKQKDAKATSNREVIQNITKQRTIIDNKIHREIHKQNWIEQKTMEMQQMVHLKRIVNEKYNKMDYLKMKKENFIKKSKKLADSTARMRENLKRSLSPDIFNRRGVSPWLTKTNGRNYPMSISPFNYESHIKLG